MLQRHDQGMFCRQSIALTALGEPGIWNAQIFHHPAAQYLPALLVSDLEVLNDPGTRGVDEVRIRTK